tara:strand:- start:349 stop:1224 length:876 start_codon:yes stop_codon:yes gene_type:complete
MRYSLEDYDKYYIEENVLPASVKTNIEYLTKSLGIDMTDVRKRKQRNDNWEKLRQPVDFKATVLKEKVGVDKQLSMIKSSLNKLCFQNYENEKVKIMDLLEQIYKTEEKSEEVLKIFINLACTNIMYAKFYVKLLHELFNKYSVLNEEFIKYDVIDKYKKSILTIEYIDSEKDFNSYCLNNKNNDKRKGLCNFIVELVTQQIYDEDNIYDLFKYLFEILNFNKESKELIYINDELIDNVYVLVNSSYDTIVKQSYYKNIQKVIVEWKSKRFDGISNRSVFKFMDIHDKCLD